jgi:TonB family protein
MKRCLRCSVGFFLAFILWQGLRAGAADDQLSLRNIFEKARDISDIRAPGIPAFRLSGELRIWAKKGSPSQGKYLYAWTPEGKWREEINLSGYKRVRSGDGKQFWQVRSSATENPSIFELDQLLRIRHSLSIGQGDTLKRLHSENIDGTEADCIRYESNRGLIETFCFNPTSGELLKYAPEKDSSELPWRAPWQQYSQFQEWAGKRFPRTLRGFNGKHLVMELQLGEITPLPQPPPDYFDPPESATFWADCRPSDAEWKVKDMTEPAYPVSARMNSKEGTVTLYAVIEEDGHVSGLHVLHSAGTELDQAATNAVSQWRYERTESCADSKGRTETAIDVTFSLQR